MIQYLEYLKRIFFTTGTKYIGIILSELTLYQKVYLKYGNLKQNNPVYLPTDRGLREQPFTRTASAGSFALYVRKTKVVRR